MSSPIIRQLRPATKPKVGLVMPSTADDKLLVIVVILVPKPGRVVITA